MSAPEVEGFDELRAKLDGIADTVATKAGRKATRLAARLIGNAIIAKAPVAATVTGAAKKYGRLKDNIRVRLARARTENTIAYKVTTGKAFWALWQEFGSRHQPSRPFIRPAFDANKDEAVRVMTEALAEGIDAAAAGAAATDA